MPARSGRSRRDADQAARLVERFVGLVRDLPYVREVRLDDRSVDACIWTLIDSPPPDDAQRDRVYDAELNAARDHTAAAVDFRLVNAAEYPNAQPEDLLPGTASVLLKR